MISQAVVLDAGRHVLSWWDQSRDPNGQHAPAASRYRVSIFDDAWRPLATIMQLPHAASGDAAWGARRVLAVDVPVRGTYRIAFGSADSVAIGDVQLERIPSGGLPSAYQDTDSSGKLAPALCHASPATLRQQFAYRCERGGACFYESMAPIAIDTRKLAANGISLEGRIAQGNFNYRHADVALNLVGSGVHDCSGSGSAGCYGSGYVEYTLEHDGSGVGIVGHDEQVRVFDFGIGAISRGKALATERYITMPIAGNDQSALSQPGILKPEMRGRPLDGHYRLRIYDTPALRWERLEDIQIVLKYRYWSRIATPGQF
jgi:hypothetical protein